MDPTPTAPAAEPAAAPVPAGPEKVQAARELIEGLLTRMGVTAQIGVEDRADGIHVAVNATAGAEALGGGRRSGVVESIAYLVNKSINRDEAGRKWVSLSVQGLPDAAPETPAAPGASAAPAAEAPAAAPIDPAVQAMADELAARVRKVGGALWVAGLPIARRNALQAALGKSAGVKVRGEGEGVHRRLVVEAS